MEGLSGLVGPAEFAEKCGDEIVVSNFLRLTRRVSRWKNGKMVMRWSASGFLATEKNFRKIMGYKDLWMLEVALGRKKGKVDNKTEAA